LWSLWGQSCLGRWFDLGRGASLGLGWGQSLNRLGRGCPGLWSLWWRWGQSCRLPGKGLDAYRGGPGGNNIKNFGGALGNIYDTGGHKRAPVIDPDHGLAVVLQIGNLEDGSEGETGMGGGHEPGVENFP
jgi:hypothetical protein